MANFDPFAYRPASSPAESAQRLIGDLAQRVGAQERANNMGALTAQTPWVVPTLANGFTPYTGSAPVRYYVDPVGRLYLSGVFLVPSPAPALSAEIFTLPAGFAPSAIVQFLVMRAFFGGVQQHVLTAYPVSAPAPLASKVMITSVDLTASSAISLDNVSFRIAIEGDPAY